MKYVRLMLGLGLCHCINLAFIPQSPMNSLTSLDIQQMIFQMLFAFCFQLPRYCRYGTRKGMQLVKDTTLTNSEAYLGDPWQTTVNLEKGH